MFGKDFTLCLLLSPFQADQILSTGEDAKVFYFIFGRTQIRKHYQVSVYGKGRKYGSRRISKMKLNMCEGHVLGQVYSAVRGYVWKEKVRSSHNVTL